MANDTEVQMGMKMKTESDAEGDERVIEFDEAVDYFYVLPEGCIAVIISMTSPVDACRFCAVSSLFKSAAESDAVWERFLPIGYQSILSQSLSGISLSYPSKKELYLSLCHNPVLIDEGKKTFFLDKWSGKKCYMLSARDLSIIWACTSAYWRWTSLPESRFEEVAELLAVCWLEIRGKIDVEILSPSTLYSAYFVFKVAPSAYGIEDQAAEIAVGFVGQEANKRSAYFKPRKAPDPETVFAKKRDDGWLEIELGEFFYMEGQIGELEMSVLQIKGGNWKSGLIVEGIEIRPKGKQRLQPSLSSANSTSSSPARLGIVHRNEGKLLIS